MADIERLQELTEQIRQGVQETFSSDRFKEFLKMTAVFHRYSARNTLLIFMQRPSATQVAGFNAWKKLNRYVKRGEKGISIFAPVATKLRQTEKSTDEDGRESSDETERVHLSFRVVPVFDIAQTEGEPLPSLCDELQGGVNDYGKIFEALKLLSPYKVEFEQITGGAKGYCSHSEKRIALNLGMADEQVVKTLLHEIAHATFHSGSRDNRERKEIEAESTAYIVANFLGFDTSSYSFEYVAAWSLGMDADELQKTLEHIQSGAHQLICRLEETLKAPEKNKVQETTKAALSDRLTEACRRADALRQEGIVKEVQKLGQAVFK